MSQQRIEQINSNIHQELSDVFNCEIEFPTDCLVTISRIVVSEDLQWAQVWVSVLPISRRTKIHNLLKKKSGFLQRELNKRLKMKPIPRLQFFTDFTEEHAQSIEQIIDRAMSDVSDVDK